MPANWRLARSLQRLREQVNAAYPLRSKASDGSIGDQSHQARKSDHDPNAAGVVTAIDITNDPDHGCDSRKLAEALIDSRDPRIKYVISSGQICSSKVQPWVWRKYTGANGHFHHVHVSVDADPSLYDSPSDWKLSASKPIPSIDDKPILKKGSVGSMVVLCQQRLIKYGFLPANASDGKFGPKTEEAVKGFQAWNGLTPDGICGRDTWLRLLV